MAMYRGGFSFAAGGGGSSTEIIYSNDSTPMSGRLATLALQQPQAGDYSYMDFRMTWFLAQSGNTIQNPEDQGWSYGKIVVDGAEHKSWWQTHNDRGVWHSGTNLVSGQTYTVGLLLGSARGSGQDFYSLEYNPSTRVLSFSEISRRPDSQAGLPNIYDILITGESG